MITLATFDEFITSIRTEFGEQGAGKKFEVFRKWFLENNPDWCKTVDKVWLWDDYAKTFNSIGSREPVFKLSESNP